MSLYNQKNKDSRKAYQKLLNIRTIDEAITQLRNEGRFWFSLVQVAEKSGLSYRTILRYIDKETLRTLQKSGRGLGDLIYGTEN